MCVVMFLLRWGKNPFVMCNREDYISNLSESGKLRGAQSGCYVWNIVGSRVRLVKEWTQK